MGVEILKKTNFTITIRYKIPSFSSEGPFSKRGVGKFRPEAEILGIFSIEKLTSFIKLKLIECYQLQQNSI